MGSDVCHDDSSNEAKKLRLLYSTYNNTFVDAYLVCVARVSV